MCSTRSQHRVVVHAPSWAASEPTSRAKHDADRRPRGDVQPGTKISLVIALQTAPRTLCFFLMPVESQMGRSADDGAFVRGFLFSR